MRWVAALALLGATLAAAPSPAPSGSPPPRSVTITCEATPLWLWTASVPRRSGRNVAVLGERFEIVDGPRGTPNNHEFYETTIPVTEPGGGEHYWVQRVCANVNP